MLGDCISQLCDQNLFVRFTKNKCLVVDESDKSVIMGVRSLNNCYLLTTPATCLKVGVYEAELWHRKLGHVNYQSMKKVVFVGDLRGILDLKAESWRLCEFEATMPQRQQSRTVWLSERIRLSRNIKSYVEC